MCINPLRKKVVDYMKNMATIEWTPDENFVTYNPGNRGGCTSQLCVYRKGVKYYGPPYINGNMTNAETFNDKRVGAYIPFPGTEEDLNKIDSVASLKAIGGEILETSIKNAFTFPGNDCMGAVQIAWNAAINNNEKMQKLQFCNNTIPFEGACVIPVGEYICDPKHGNNTDLICEENGEQVMARAYAQLRPGDAVTHVKSIQSNARHIRLVVGEPYVEYKTLENGEKIINMDISYVKLLDQAGGASRRYVKGSIKSSMQEHEWKFIDLYKGADLPITLPELVSGDNGVENTVLEDAVLDTLFTEKKITGKITSNRQIIYARAEITDGTTIYTIKDIVPMAIRHKRNYHNPEYDLANLDFSCFNFKEDTQYTFNLFVCTSGNEGKEINLVKDFKREGKYRNGWTYEEL
jgi:hypothetical protein